MVPTPRPAPPRAALALLLAALLIPSAAPETSAQAVQFVTASVETEPVASERDSADDTALWIHPTDPSQSLIIGTSKKTSLEVYDMTGARRQAIPGDPNNVDVSYNFPLSCQLVDIAVATYISSGSLKIYRINPISRLLEDVTEGGSIDIEGSGNGIAIYRSPISGTYYAITNSGERVQQLELYDAGDGTIGARLVRKITYSGSKGESVAVDEVHGLIYASAETFGLLKYPAEPDAGSTATVVDTVEAEGGRLTADVEGVAVYYKSDGTGYLFVSSQGANAYDVYRREGDNEYIGRMQIVDGEIDGTQHTDGIDVTNFPIGPAFPSGIFFAQDGANDDNGQDNAQNFKLVPFERIAAAFGLSMDTSWNPRAWPTAAPLSPCARHFWVPFVVAGSE